MEAEPKKKADAMDGGLESGGDTDQDITPLLAEV
jgi:hypothetical protein